MYNQNNAAIMRTYLVAGCLLFTANVYSQTTPIVPVYNLNTFSGPTLIQGPFELFAPYQGVGPVLIYNTAKVDFIAGERVHLQPGFQASNFSADGYFHAQIGTAPDFDVVFIEPNVGYPQVGLHNKLELGLRLPATLESQVQNFIGGSGGINPFDEQQIKVQATFTNSLSTVTIDGFYYEEFLRDGDVMGSEVDYNWFTQPTVYNWRIRFAPPFLGTWHTKIEIFLGNNLTPISSIEGIEFGCVPSNNPGYLRVGADNRHLKFSSTGESFFAIGQNIAWADGPWFRGRTFNVTPYGRTGGILDVSDWITSLADNGGNFVRFIVTPEFGEVEWGTLGNYASVNSSENNITSNTGLAQAWELDQMFNLCEEKNVYMMFNVAYQGEWISKVEEPWHRWEGNPYNVGINGVSNPPDLFRDPLVHAEVMRNMKNKFRYYLSRWGYSTSLGVFELFSEMENWDGNGGISEPNNANDGIREDAYAFLEEIALDIKSTDVGNNHLLSISIAKTPWDDVHNPADHVFDSPLVDVTSYHGYHKERSAAKTYFTECNSNFGQGMFADWDKPSMASEMGIFHEYEINTVPVADEGDITSCSDITFHNYMWSTAFSGSYGAGLNWWQWFNDDYRENNFPAISTFFSTIDFEQTTFNDPGRWDDGHIVSGNRLIESVYLKSQTHDHAIGWAHNMSYWWGNIDQNCVDRYGRVMPINQASDDDDEDWSSPHDPENFASPIIEGMNFGRYSVQKYFVRGVGGTNGTPETVWTDMLGRLPLHAFDPQEGDYAFKADLDPLFNFRSSGVLYLDTVIVCSIDSIEANATFVGDSSSVYSYKWYINDSTYSFLPHPIFYFSNDGEFTLRLEIRDLDSIINTITQTFVVVSCDTSSTLRIVENMQQEPLGLAGLNVYPNPVDDQLFITSDSSCSVAIYSTDGRLMGYYLCPKVLVLNVSSWTRGLYMVVSEFNGERYCKRILIID